MYLRVTRVKRPNKTYQYAQLVESYRRKSDGMPTNRVLANLGNLSDVEIANIQAALKASKEGKRVVLEAASAEAIELLRPDANLQYLDVAVLLEVWNEWGLGELFDRLIPAGDALVRPADVIASLVIHRCVGPLRDRSCSKLSATEWFAETALPELLHFSPSRFNNTRLHRVLEQLEEAAPELMEALPQRYVDREGAFTALFADLTDALFVGDGPDLAVRGRTKAGHIQRRVGIALLCNRAGYPLYWEVVAGNAAEQPVLTDLYQAVAAESWVQGLPVVCDRIMGASKNIRDLLRTDVRFLTALQRTEFSTYGQGIPWEMFEAVPQATEPEEAIAAVSEAAERAGFERVSDSLFVLDLGTVEPFRAIETTPAEAPDRGRTALELAIAGEELKESGQVASYAAAARQLGISSSMLRKYRALRRLRPEVQAQILAGRARGLSIYSLLNLRSIKEADKQRKRLDELAATASAPRRTGGQSFRDPEAIRVRVVAYLNPALLLEQQGLITEKRQKIRRWADDLNESLAKPTSRMTRDKILAAVDRRLRKESMLDSYEVRIASQNRHFQVELQAIEGEFQRRYRCAGFTILVAHPQLDLPAAELPQLYRAKDQAIEKSFRTIKSVLKLEPVRHHTDPKVRAHVVLCMLALLLERTLKQKLEGKWSASRALNILSPCNLNQFAPPAQGLPVTYLHTRPRTEQRRILQALQLEHLLDDDQIAACIRPRFEVL
jgi:transposase